MIKNRRVLALVSAIAMAATVVSGCSVTTTSTSTTTTTPASSESAAAEAEDAGAAEASEDGPFGKYAEPITISVVKDLGQSGLDFPDGDSLDNNVWTRYDEDTLNIKFDWLWSVPSDQYTEKVNIAITSGDIPDIMKVTASQLKMMVENEQLADLTDLYAPYVDSYTDEILNADGGSGLESATFNGRLMAIPQVSGSLMSADVLWVRTDWLDNLGLELPETVDDFYAIAEAFTKNDPDGNGADDTFGLGINKDLINTGFADTLGFFNMYNAYPDIWIEKDGALANGSIQPEVKDALAALQGMYADGYIDPEFGVKDANKVNEDACAGKIGMMFGTFWNMAWLNDTKVDNPDMEWVPVAIPGGASAQIPFGTTTYYVVSSECEHPEAAFKLLNVYLDKIYGAHAESTTYGITTDGWGPYAWPVIQLEPAMKNFDAAVNVTAALENHDPSALNEEEKGYYDYCVRVENGDYTENAWHQYKMFGPNGSLTVDLNYWNNGQIVSDAYCGAPTDSMAEKQSTLDKQELTDFTEIIMGGSVDEFDEFVNNWLNLGGQQITDEVNEWYSAR